MNKQFKDITEASVVYVFTGKRIVEAEVLQFQRIDDATIFLRVKDMGIVIFQDGTPRMKKGEVEISLCKDAFGSEILLSLKKKIDNLRQEITNHRQKIHWEKEQIAGHQQRIDMSLRQIESLQSQVEEMKNEIDNEYSTLSQV